MGAARIPEIHIYTGNTHIYRKYTYIPEIHIYTGNTQIYRTLPIDLQVGVYSTSKWLHYQIPNMYWIHNKAHKKHFSF